MSHIMRDTFTISGSCTDSLQQNIQICRCQSPRRYFEVIWVLYSQMALLLLSVLRNYAIHRISTTTGTLCCCCWQ